MKRINSFTYDVRPGEQITISVTPTNFGGRALSRGFLTDVLSDRVNGISVWTLVLGILFSYSIWYRLSMPEFSATLLALLGISSGTNLGFKIPENQNPPAKTE
jgi:hypothetical protein